MRTYELKKVYEPSTDWKRINGSASKRYRLSHWRRKLPDGSILTATPNASAQTKAEKWIWEHRGPEIEIGVGLKLNEQGKSTSSLQARRDADSHARERLGIKAVGETLHQPKPRKKVQSKESN